MAKILKQLMFGQKKNPPAPPRPDYVGNKKEDSKFADHLYANVSSFSLGAGSSVRFEEKSEENKLVVFEEYSEPADLRAELAALAAEEEYGPLYMSPVDQLPRDGSTSQQEEEMYSVPYEGLNQHPTLPSTCMNTVGSSYSKGTFQKRLEEDYISDSDCYDAVADSIEDGNDHFGTGPSKPKDEGSASFNATHIPGQEYYDEPWEWPEDDVEKQHEQPIIPADNPTSSSPDVLLVDTHNVEDHTYSEPTASPQGALCDSTALSDADSCSEEIEDMTTRQRRLYETAFDSRVKPDIDDIDMLMQSPVLQGDIFRARIKPGEAGPVLRTASRSSFGSTSGSSTSSTPTHQPQIVSKPSPRPRHYPLHLTPTERRKVTLIRDSLPARSSSPLSRPIKVITSVDPLTRFNNRNSSSNGRQNDNRLISSFERQLSLSQWDSASRCSDKSSSSQESMDQREDFAALSSRMDEPRVYPLGKSASRDSISFRDSPSRNLNNQVRNKNLVENASQDSPFCARKLSLDHSGFKVQPIDNSRIIAKTLNNPTCSTSSSSSITLNPTQNVLNRQLESPTRQLSNVTSLQPLTSDENNDKPVKAVRPTSLLGKNCPNSSPAKAQTPDNDDRPSDDYDPPWEFKPGPFRSSVRVNGSQSVPECLSRNIAVDNTSSENVDEEEQESGAEKIVTTAGEPPSNNSETEPSDNLTAPPATKPSKPSGLPARPNLNLNLNLNSNSPRKARQGLTLNFGCAALCAVGEKVDADLTLEKQGWYHGSISRHDAENLLRVLKEGSYLVRNSESSKNDYSLSLKSARGFMHMKIVQTDGRFILGQFSNPFSSIPEMVHHYSINKLPIKGAEHMSLLYPVIDQLL